MKGIAKILLASLLAVSCSGNKVIDPPTGPTPNRPTQSCGKQYCGSVSYTQAWFNAPTPNGFGWNWTGWIDLTLSPVPISPVRVQVNLDGFSISGFGDFQNVGSRRIDLSGSSLSCIYDRDRQFVVFDGANNVLAFLPLRWSGSPHC